MIILIAESKTMANVQRMVSAEEYAACRSVYDEFADETMASLRNLSQEQLASDIGISRKFAVKVEKMVFDFPDKSRGFTSMEGFTGVVFDALDYPSLQPESKDFLDRNLRIVSSLYGWLRPSDIIKPYRLEFKFRIPGESLMLQAYWKGRLQENLLTMASENNDMEILDLLPADAEKCLGDMGRAQGLKVFKPDFRIAEGRIRKTPHAGELKRLRGGLLREIAEGRIASFKDLSVHFGDSIPFI